MELILSFFHSFVLLFSEGDKPSLLSVNPGLIIWTMVVFVLFVLLLKKLAWKPLIGALNQREESILNAIENAEKLNKEAEQLIEQNKKNLADANAQSMKIINESKDAANKVREDLIQKANEDARKILDNAKMEIEKQKESALSEMKDKISEIAVQAAEKIISENLDAKKQRELIGDFLSKVTKTNVMVNSKIARRYSTALLEEADRQSLTDVIVKDAAVVIKAINDSRELQLFFQSPVIDKDKKLSIVTEIFKGKINQLSFSLISLMVSRKREAETKNVFEDFLELRDERNGIAKAEVVTAVELTEEEKKDIKLKIDHYSKLNSLPTFKVDKSVIGGFKIKIKDTILDASIKRQLELLLKKFKEGGVSLN